MISIPSFLASTTTTVSSSWASRAVVLLFAATRWRSAFSFSVVGPSPSTTTTVFGSSAASLRNAFVDVGFSSSVSPLRATKDNDEEEDDDDEDYMAAWREAYPDLEFVDYNDPEYKIDMGLDEQVDESFVSSALSGPEADAEVERMREERRRRNDEYQFETYHEKVLGTATRFSGEWEIFETRFRNGPDAPPELRRRGAELAVDAVGRKVVDDPNAEWRVDGEYLAHEETATVTATVTSDDDDAEIVRRLRCWPTELRSGDFRGPAGIMTVGNAHTVCRAEPENTDDGPYSVLVAEVGLRSEDMRLRVRSEWRRDPSSSDDDAPLLLAALVAIRERAGKPPRDPARRVSADLPLFGPPGAPGGLYDPPPVCDPRDAEGTQAERYVTVDLDGGATVLLPFRVDQAEDAFDGHGWVMTLDWTPGNVRYQVDRKTNGGKGVKGLRTLEVSEVQAEDANKYRPRDGGADMRQ